MQLYILLPVHNRIEITRKFIACLRSQIYSNYHLILIDDGSKDGTQGMVKENIPDVSIIQGDGNWWWGGSLHQGYLWLRRMRIDSNAYVLIINDDTEFKEDFLQNAMNFMSKNTNCLLLAQAYSNKTGKIIDTGTFIEWSKFTFHDTKYNNSINCLSTRGLFLRAGDFFKIGGFHPILLPHYGSDYEYSTRAFNMGYRLITDRSVFLISNEDATGYHSAGGKRDVSLRKIFSKRSTINPLYLLNFILLSCPWRYKFNALYHGIILKIVRHVFHPQ